MMRREESHQPDVHIDGHSFPLQCFERDLKEKAEKMSRRKNQSEAPWRRK
jgi:hypothetical protein